jgi:hypothetical protein
VSADSLARIINNLSAKLAASVRSGDALVSEARQIVAHVREARGWLLTVENELDPTTTTEEV